MTLLSSRNKVHLAYQLQLTLKLSRHHDDIREVYYLSSHGDQLLGVVDTNRDDSKRRERLEGS